MEDYLHGFSANVKEIIRRFNLESQMEHMAHKDVLLDVLEKFTSPLINRHQPLRSMEDVAKDIVTLEQQAEGLIAEVLGLEVADVSGVKHD